MLNRSSALIALAVIVLTCVGALWIANILFPYVPSSGEGARPDNYTW